MQKKSVFEIFYLTQFPVNFSDISKKNRLFVKNIILYLLFITFIFSETTNSFVKFNFIRIKNKSFITIKAPYRNKITRNQYLKRNYFYKLTIDFTYSNPMRPNLFFVLKRISNLLVTFEFSFFLANYVTVNLYYSVNPLNLFINAQNSKRL